MPIAAPVTMATFPDSLAMTCSAVVFFNANCGALAGIDRCQDIRLSFASTRIDAILTGIMCDAELPR
jgi:hypothetical protein